VNGTQIPTDPAMEGPRTQRSKRGRRILGLILAMLIILLLVVSYFLFRLLMPQGEIARGSDAKGIEWVRSIYGWGRGPASQLSAPGSVAFGPDGTIWVPQGDRGAAGTRGAIVGFRPDGTFKQFIGLGKLRNPTDVAAGPDGTIYAVESDLDLLWAFSPSNQELFRVNIKSPMSVAASADRIAVGSSAGFVVFDKNGNVIVKLGTFGKGPGQFDSVNGIAIGKDGTVFVSDMFNNRISAYDSKGKGLWIVSTGVPGNQQKISGAGNLQTTTKAPARLQLPAQLTVDGAGRIVVVDPFDFSLTVLSAKNGSVIAKYGAQGQVDGQFTYPTGVAYDAQRDWFAVADTQNNRLQVVRIPGSGATAASELARSLEGPLRACLLPLILLLIALISAAVIRRRRKVAQARAALQATAVEGPVPVPVVPVDQGVVQESQQS
jgi:outer membrane protein assembly factor BamB